MQLGHIGYGIRSTARQHGLATWALGRIPDEARGLGLTRMLTICEAGDLAAVKTIEPHGGVLEDVRDTCALTKTDRLENANG